MTAPTKAGTAPATSRPDRREGFLRTYTHEVATTLKVLRAYPADKLELRPHPRCKSAGELAAVFVAEQRLAMKGLTDGLDWSKPLAIPPAPETIEGIVAAFDAGSRSLAEVVRNMSDEQFDETVQFPVGPGKLGEWSKRDFLWMILFDQVHHRGQFSIYLRMADAKVPSIYGPTADEPWT